MTLNMIILAILISANIMGYRFLYKALREKAKVEKEFVNYMLFQNERMNKK